MSVRRIIALIVGLAVDPWEPTEYSLLSHCLDIAIDGCSPDFWLLNSHLIENIIRREMPASTGRTDDIAILVGSHIASKNKFFGNLRSSRKLEQAHFLYFTRL